MPVQEPGGRPARALPYTLAVDAQLDRAAGVLALTFRNAGTAAAVFHVRPGAGSVGGPWSYTVGPAGALSDRLALDVNSGAGYDFSVYGPNGFLRAFQGSIAANPAAELEVTAECAALRLRDGVVIGGITLDFSNAGAAPLQATVLHGYTQQTETVAVPANGTARRHWLLETTSGWYDMVVKVVGDIYFQRHIAGHVETGNDSVSDPAIGQA